MEELGRRLASAAVARPWTTIALAGLLLVPLAVGAARARMSTDYRVFFDEDDPNLATFERLEEVFTRTDNVVFVVRRSAGTIFEPRALGAIDALTRAAWRLPFASRVDSLTNFQTIRSEGDDVIVGDLVPAGADLSPSALAAIRRSAERDPLLVGGLLGRDGRTAGVNVTLRLPREEPTEVAEAAAAARRLAARVERANPGLEIRVSGMAMMNDAFMEASIEDMSTLIPGMYLALVVTMLLLLRSVWSTLAVMTGVLLSSVATLALAGWCGLPLTPPSAATPMIVLTLGVADGIHVVLSVRAFRRRGLVHDRAIVEALAENCPAILLTGLTTIVGFLCLNFAESPPYGHLGNMSAAGVLVVLLSSLTLLPALMRVLPAPALRPAPAAGASLARRYGAALVRWHRHVLGCGAALTVAAGLCAAQLETNDRFLEFFDRSIQFRPDTEFLNRHLSGLYGLEFQVDTGAPGGIGDPRNLRRLAEFAAWLRAQPEVEHVVALTDVLVRVRSALSGQATLPGSREEASQLLLLYEMSLPAGRDLTDRVDVDKSATRVSVRLKDLSSRDLRVFERRSEAWLRAHTPRAMWAEATSPVVIFSYMSERNAESMVAGNLLDLLLIALVLVFALKSVRLGLLSLVPNVAPMVLVYGAWWLLVGEVDVVASVAGTICLGIIVDDTMHFLSRYQRARREQGLDCPAAIEETFATSGVAIGVTTVVLVVGFAVLMFSGFQMNSTFGRLAVSMIATALAADLILTPALLLVLDRGPSRAPILAAPRSPGEFSLPALNLDGRETP